ncbi:MAG: UDP-N-acetylmuramate--L-alanine ligase [Clostridia bacterium]|nr:UDP-N-acetylmuramate--L-alanine ligase [Clostridia bacterium]
MTDRLSGKRVHFIGVGGISMSALARIARSLGATVSGSDRAESEAFLSLRSEGYDVWIGSRPERAAASDLTVYTAAIPEGDPERIAAADRAISRASFLAEISALFDKTVAVAGTHGKTTVSAMIACVAAAAGESFSAHIGGVVRNFDSNILLAGDRLFVTEACEYRDSFLSLSPDLAIVLNVEKDHSDWFRRPEDLDRSFTRFVSRVRDGGTAILGEGVSSHVDVCENEHIRILRYGEDFGYERAEGGGFYLTVKGEPRRYFLTHAKGMHNLYNAAIAAYACLLMGIREDAVRMGLAAFLGVKRRYEYMGNTAGGAAVVHDYAHHPTEIAAVMRVAREETEGRVIVAFEPHTFSRTAALFDEFVSVLSDADVVVMLPTYSARETPAAGVDARTLFCALRAKERYYFSDYEAAKRAIDRIARSRDEVLILGAGGIEELGELFDSDCV